PDVPKYDFKSKKESWGDSGEEDDDDEDDSVDESDDGDDNNDDDYNDGNDGNDGDGDDDDDDADDDDNQEVDDMNNDDEETDKEEENINDEEKMDEEEDDKVTKELYNDVNVNLGNRDAEMTDADQGGADQQNKTDEPVQSSSVSSDFTSKLLNLENPFLADNEIASLMDTTIHRKEPGSQTLSLYTIPIMAVPFNDRVTNLEKDISKIKQVDQYAQALSSIPAIVDRYIDNKLREAIQKAIVSHKWTVEKKLKLRRGIT
ncbi:hypothetical protein Tco_0061675, partial [Tanacetum coccineum]